MRRTILTAALAAAGVAALAGTASADVGDIDAFSVNGDPEGTATAAEIDGRITCTTGIEYGLVAKVAQTPEGTSPSQQFGSPPGGTGASSNDQPVEGVGAFGPNQGNEDNSPCSTTSQAWELTIQNNRDSGPYQDGDTMGILVFAGTSANNGTRGPGPFIGDLEYAFNNGSYERNDP